MHAWFSLPLLILPLTVMGCHFESACQSHVTSLPHVTAIFLGVSAYRVYTSSDIRYFYVLTNWGWMNGWMDGQTDGWMDGWTDGRTDGRTDGWTDIAT